MPKHGWKWRTETFRGLDRDEQEEYLNDWDNHISARFGKWAYLNLPLTERAKRAALVVIGSDLAAPWTDDFLFRELDKLWTEQLGSFVVSALGRKATWNPILVSQLEGLFANTEADLSVRAVSLHVLGHSLIYCPRYQTDDFKNRLRKMCDQAIWDDSSPDMRASACVAAFWLDGYESRIIELAQDQTVNYLGNSVASEASKWAACL